MKSRNQPTLHVIQLMLAAWHDANLNILAISNVGINISVPMPSEMLTHTTTYMEALSDIDVIIGHIAIRQRNSIDENDVTSGAVNRIISQP